MSNVQNFNPKVSIIIPVYNGSNYLKEAIDSALAQTYSNIEILVINDGSKDDGATENIALSYGEKIRYFYKENGGVASALNMGIEKMEGDYFSWLSHDDVYYPEKINTQILYISKLNDKNIVLYSNWDVINNLGKMIHSVRHQNTYKMTDLNLSLFPVFNGLIHGCSLLISKKIFMDIGSFDITLPTTQDYAMWFRILQNYPVHFIPEPLIMSRAHEEQGSISDSRHYKEANDLWINMIDRVSPENILSFNKSIREFYVRVRKHLLGSPLEEAKQHVSAIVDKLDKTFSVVIPTYDRRAQVFHAVESVLKQKVPNGYNLEIIIIDDGSSDATKDILLKYIDGVKVKYFFQTNQGASVARNNGISYSSGKFIGFLDSDDIWLQDHVAKHIEAFNATDIVLCCNSARIYNPKLEVVSEMIGHFNGYYYPQCFFIKGNIFTTPSISVLHDVINEVGGFNTTMKMCEDLELWSRICKVGTIRILPEILTEVFLRENQFDADQYLLHRWNFVEKTFLEKELDAKVKNDLLLDLLLFYFTSNGSFTAITNIFVKAVERHPEFYDYLKNSLSNYYYSSFLEIGTKIFEDNILVNKKLNNQFDIKTYAIAKRLAKVRFVRFSYFYVARPTYRILRRIKNYVKR
jgi:glycosyltransferase involved in cell wall biosynthesis